MQKRFIAGAICPSCGLEDKIFVYQENNYTTAECVRCGFKQEAVASPKGKAPTTTSAKKSRKIVWLKPQTESNK